MQIFQVNGICITSKPNFIYESRYNRFNRSSLTAIISLLNKMEYQVCALIHSKQPDFDYSNAEIVNGDLFDTASLEKFSSGCDVVIHCAGKVSINSNNDSSVYETNVHGTVNIFNAAKQASVKRFIHVSSIHAFNQFPQNEMLDEARSYCLDNAPRYDKSKSDAQKFVLQHESDTMKVIVLNPTSIAVPITSLHFSVRLF